MQLQLALSQRLGIAYFHEVRSVGETHATTRRRFSAQHGGAAPSRHRGGLM